MSEPHALPSHHEDDRLPREDVRPPREDVRPPARTRLWRDVMPLVAAATGGVVARHGTSAGLGLLGPFTAVGRLALGLSEAEGPWAMLAATITGVMVHVALAGAWTAALVAVAREWTGARLWVAAGATGVLAWSAGHWLLPPVLRLGHGSRAFPPQVVLLHVVLALSLAIGMRLAQLRYRVEQ